MSFFQEQNADSAEKISPITLCTIFQPKKSNLVGFKKKPLQLVKRETQKKLSKEMIMALPSHCEKIRILVQ